jgi:hypothetical protein
VPQDKENYDYLVERCDQFVRRHHGRIRAVGITRDGTQRSTFSFPCLNLMIKRICLCSRTLARKPIM